MTQPEPAADPASGPLTGPVRTVSGGRRDQEIEGLSSALSAQDLTRANELLKTSGFEQIVTSIERLGARQRAVAFRLLPKDTASEVFEALSPGLQSDLVQSLHDRDVVEIFAELDPDDRVWLLDELPAGLTARLLRDLPEREQQLTHEVLGWPQGSIGHRMSPELVSAREDESADVVLERVRRHLGDAETVYLIPVVDDTRRIQGAVTLRELLAAEPQTQAGQLMSEARVAHVQDSAEDAARRCTERGLIAMPVVDSEDRLLGILSIGDAARILVHEENEDAARQGGSEPLGRPYLSTPILRLVRSRLTWLLVLAIGATLTVQVLEVFEATLEQVTVLALFVPLLIGTGGNTGNQAATTVTRALALQDVQPRDVMRVLGRELRVGLCLGTVLGLLGLLIAGLVYSVPVGLIIGLTLLAVCTLAASVGGVMPIIARALKVDPAVFSNPFITTFVDAAGLIVYFLIARAILGI